MLFKICPRRTHPIPEPRVVVVVAISRRWCSPQAGFGISLPRRSGKPGRSLACHRDMLAVQDKVLEHAATLHSDFVSRVGVITIPGFEIGRAHV